MNHVIIEKEKLEHNIHLIKEKAASVKHPPKIIAVIKGNAYGMDAILLAKKLSDNNINFFAVSETCEAKKLRDNNFNNPILLLKSTCIEQEINEIIDLNLIATVGSIEAIQKLNERAKEKGKNISAHLKIDTGFSRFGFIIDDECIQKLKSALSIASNIKIEGAYSHFAESYSNSRKQTEKQFSIFMKNVSMLRENGIDTGMLHICNSSAFFKYSYMYLDAVRIGSAFTGRLQIKEPTGLKKVGYLETEVCEIKEIMKGSKIGYSGTCTLKRDSKVAILGVGYETGAGVTGMKDAVRFVDKMRTLKSALKNFMKDRRMFVNINGKSYPLLGRIGMKNMVIDVTDGEVKVGDRVEVPARLIFVNPNIERQER